MTTGVSPKGFCTCKYPLLHQEGNCLRCELPYKAIIEMYLRASKIALRQRDELCGDLIYFLKMEMVRIIQEAIIDIPHGNLFSPQKLVSTIQDGVCDRIRRLSAVYKWLKWTLQDEEEFKCPPSASEECLTKFAATRYIQCPPGHFNCIMSKAAPKVCSCEH